MGSLHIEKVEDQGHQQNALPGMLSQSLGDSDGFRAFKIDGLASDQTNSPSGLKEETLLLSWLMVLLRTQEAGHIRYDWAYKSRISKHNHETMTRTLTMDVVTRLGDSIRQVSADIHEKFALGASKQSAAIPNHVSLILKRYSKSSASDKGNIEVRK